MDYKEAVNKQLEQDIIISEYVKKLPLKEIGNAKIDSFTVDSAEVERCKMDAMFKGTYGEYYDFKPGTYKRLLINNKTMMSNTPMEIRTNRGVMNNANGHVLIAGLGMGVILMPIYKNKNVKSITVVEYNKSVIDLVKPCLPGDIKIIHKDIHEFEPEIKYDVIYFDIWLEIDSDNWDEMKKLTKKFKYKLNRSNSNCWMSSWRKDKIQSLVREEKNSVRWPNSIFG